jgi:RNA-directed DNA polymerase
LARWAAERRGRLVRGSFIWSTRMPGRSHVDGQRLSGKPFAVSKEEVWRAYLKVRANGGAAGADGVTLEVFEARLKDNLYKVWNRMASGSYFPPPVKAVEIPKDHGRGTRMLGVPTEAA